MKNDILMGALKQRRGRKFDAKEFDKVATAGMDSDDLKETTKVILGDGVKEKNLRETHGSGSSDELAPSKQEMRAQNIDTGEDAKKKKKKEPSRDEEVFDEQTYHRAMNKTKPSTLFERMQMNLGQKLNR